FDDYGHMRF
uniref:Neosulfakinin-1 n=1 Tax=Sarcophaga bullata TaxID=7385 RepID=NSK1_SARBU|nr:RecName: Full=Neosulfakinin-1; AltName: Full=Neosulfakinin-I; Short=Neb-SK-I [Sarcophaga bullata]prf//1906225A sulfakinin-like peptide I [Sarcophaga bullata]